ncbi:aspartate kinase [Shimazuella alba]|jgi:aspartate kinase|uniref:Aspartokinase n=1 Tax=Shimazuella alba TaxID=2690964 RepID=A0A6I4W2E1_9BACL|nr:aspartate kinase [Shimazuella alba]MXQ54944.1 aspartate kinase [Shimazuella alba]
MKVIVQKFGGTSVATSQMRERVLYHIQTALSEDYQVVVVVSAMGRRGEPYATDTLLELTRGEQLENLSSREQDLLLSCGEIISASVLSSLLTHHGIENCVLTGGQAGIITNNQYNNAQIVSLNPKRLQDELNNGKVAIVAGFQGQTADGEITTLGRGGSDTTATALGVALQAEYVDIFTDVDGVLTADPRIVEEAASLEMVTYTEMCNLAFQGAKVVHPRAVEIAMQTNVPIRVRSTLSDGIGTLVVSRPERLGLAEISDRLITGITQMPNVTQIRIPTNSDHLDLHLDVFRKMASQGISVDFISVTPSSIAYTVSDPLGDLAKSLLVEMGLEPELYPGCAKVSVVGAGIAGVPGVMAKILEALTEEDVKVLQSADSHTTIWVLVSGENMVKAVRALHRKFELHKY